MFLADFLTEAGERPIYYFAYGMLTDPEIMQGLELVGLARLPNFRYEMLQFADVVPTPGSEVYGCLWQVDRRVIARLDQIEGYPQLYDRKTVPVFVDGQRYEAELYTMTPATRQDLAGTMPSQRYVNQIVRGYENAGVPLHQLKLALKQAYRQRKVDEVAMNPKAFAASLEKAETQGVLVGFEFEVLVPEATISGGQTPAEVNKFTHENIQRIFTESNWFDNMSISGLPVEKFDSVFKLKPEFTEARFPSATEALNGFKIARLENAKKVFEKIPPKVRAKFIGQMNLRDYKNTVDGQLAFANRLGYMIYLNSRGELEMLGAELRQISVAQYYSELVKFWLGKSPQWLDLHVNAVFDYDPEQAYNVFDLHEYEEDDYDDYDDYHDYDYDGAVKVLEPAVKQAFGRKVRVFNDYHEENKNLKDWYIEPDGSLTPNNDNSRDGAAEIVSPPLPAGEAVTALKNFYAMANQLNLYTNSSTGLHINISIPQELDVLKLAVFLGDRYVLQQFGREKSAYAVSAEKSIQQKAPGKLTRQGKIDYTKLQKIAKDATGFHTASISDNGKYISFRHAGGDYLSDYAKIANTVGRFIRAMVIAADPAAYNQEYQVKLAKLTQSTSAEMSPVDYLRTTGVPALTAYVWIRGRASLNVQISHIKGSITDNDRSARLAFFKESNIEATSDAAKQAIVSTLRNESLKEIAAQSPATQFYKLTLIPGDLKAITAAQQYRERGVEVLNSSYYLLRKETLPPTDPIAQTLLKTALRAKYKK